MVGAAYRDRQRVRRVGGNIAGLRQQAAHHEGDLILVRTACADNGELHFSRGKLVNLEPCASERGHCGTAGLTQQQSGFRVDVHEGLLDRRLIGLMRIDDGAQLGGGVGSGGGRARAARDVLLGGSGGATAGVPDVLLLKRRRGGIKGAVSARLGGGGGGGSSGGSGDAAGLRELVDAAVSGDLRMVELTAVRQAAEAVALQLGQLGGGRGSSGGGSKAAPPHADGGSGDAGAGDDEA